MASSNHFAVGVWILVAASSCAQKLSLERRPCPCAAGFHCCASIDACRLESQACPADVPSAGSGGAAQTHDSGEILGTSGSGGSGGIPNAAGAEGSVRDAAGVRTDAETPPPTEAGSDTTGSTPRWRSLGEASLADYEVRGACDLELDPSGTPYVAIRACPKCSSLDPRPPVVLRYDGSAFRQLPEQGLPPTTLQAPLVIGAGDLPYVLVGDVIESFDGTSWQAIAPPVTAVLTPDRNFELDAEGRFAVTAYDASQGVLSVLRLEAGAWRAVGVPLTSDPQGERLAAAAGSLWLAHTSGRTGAPGAGKLYVRKLEGGVWSVIEELPAAALAFAVAGDESVYVVRQSVSPGPASVTEGRGATWTEIRSFSPLDIPVLRVAPDGSLFATYLMDGFVNLSRWDGSGWNDFDVEELGTASSTPALRIATRAGRLVPYLCFARGTALNVMKYE